MKEKILYSIGFKHISLLIPRKDGKGFIKSFGGHHGNELTKFINEIGWWDKKGRFFDGFFCVSGIDGTLDIDLNADLTEIDRIVSKIAAYKNLPYQCVSPKEFYRISIEHMNTKPTSKT